MATTGQRCLEWQIFSNHPEFYIPSDGGKHNYCRSPDGDEEGVWCYVDYDLDAWEYCEIPQCGVTCSDCIDGFWGLDADGCKICVCNSAGTVPESFCDKTDGQCVCKKNVQGVQCDQCKDQFYNLTADNDLGCRDCGCNTDGTIDGSNSCNKSNGQCLCKDFTRGRACDYCMNNTYGLSAMHIAGCLPCNCDPFGVEKGRESDCDPITGQCTCLMTRVGRRCERFSLDALQKQIDVLDDNTNELFEETETLWDWLAYTMNLHACTDGLMINDSCYFLLAMQLYNFDDATRLCQSLKSHLAYINSDESFKQVRSYIREKVIRQYGIRWPTDTGDYINVWLGAEFDTSQPINGRSLRFLDDSTYAGANWMIDYPTIDPDYTRVAWRLSLDEESSYQGYFNAKPESKFFCICQKLNTLDKIS